MDIKILEEIDIFAMQRILEDDNMVFDRENLEKFITTKNCYGFIAKDRDLVIGFGYGYSLVRPDGKTMFYLHSIGVLPEFQNQGIGGGIMNFVIDFAKSKGFSEVFVITDKGNIPACRLYEKTGFENDIENEIVYVCEFKK